MSKIHYVGMSDLIKLTTKTIEENERTGIQTVLQQCAAASAIALTEKDLTVWCDKLSAYRALSDTVAAVRAHIVDAKSLNVFATTLMQYVRSQGEMLSSTIRSVPRQEDVRVSASGESHAQRPGNDEERLAWDLIRSS